MKKVTERTKLDARTNQDTRVDIQEWTYQDCITVEPSYDDIEQNDFKRVEVDVSGRDYEDSNHTEVKVEMRGNKEKVQAVDITLVDDSILLINLVGSKSCIKLTSTHGKLSLRSSVRTDKKD